MRVQIADKNVTMKNDIFLRKSVMSRDTNATRTISGVIVFNGTHHKKRVRARVHFVPLDLATTQLDFIIIVYIVLNGHCVRTLKTKSSRISENTKFSIESRVHRRQCAGHFSKRFR